MAKAPLDLSKITAKKRRQMQQRGWSDQEAREAFEHGSQQPAVNKATGGLATRYIHPTTGKSLVVDDATGEPLHLEQPIMPTAPRAATSRPMGTPIKDPTLRQLPPELLNLAYVHENEAAWTKEPALKALDQLAALGVAVLGGEIWLATQPGPTIPTPYIYTWDAGPRLAHESWPAYVQRCRSEARAYIEQFGWNERDVAHQQSTPYFNLTLCTEQEYQAL